MNAPEAAAKFIADNMLNKEYSLVDLHHKLTALLVHVHAGGGEQALDDWLVQRDGPIMIAFDITYPQTLPTEEK